MPIRSVKEQTLPVPSPLMRLLPVDTGQVDQLEGFGGGRDQRAADKRPMVTRSLPNATDAANF